MMKIMRGVNRRGQSAIELAILGSLILIGFAAVMQYGQKLYGINQAKMESFRKAMSRAWIMNANASYTLKKNTREAALESGYGRGSAGANQASSSVMWVKGKSGYEAFENTLGEQQTSFNYYEYSGNNGTLGKMLGDSYFGLPGHETTTVGYDGSETTILVPESVYSDGEVRTENYHGTLGNDATVIKGETNSDITITKGASVTDSGTGTFMARWDSEVDEEPWDDEVPDPIWVAGTTSSASISKGYNYGSSWTTPHDLNGSNTPQSNTVQVQVNTNNGIYCLMLGGSEGSNGCTLTMPGTNRAKAEAEAQQMLENLETCHSHNGSWVNNSCFLSSVYAADQESYARQECSSRGGTLGNNHYGGYRCSYPLTGRPLMSQEYQSQEVCRSSGLWYNNKCYQW